MEKLNQKKAKCTKCNGTGMIGSKTCPSCKGTGKKELLLG